MEEPATSMPLPLEEPRHFAAQVRERLSLRVSPRVRLVVDARPRAEAASHVHLHVSGREVAATVARGVVVGTNM